jgi:hypothetical protein
MIGQIPKSCDRQSHANHKSDHVVYYHNILARVGFVFER